MPGGASFQVTVTSAWEKAGSNSGSRIGSMGRYEHCVVKRERRENGGWRQVRALIGHSRAQEISVYLGSEGLCPTPSNRDTAQCLMVMEISQVDLSQSFTEDLSS